MGAKRVENDRERRHAMGAQSRGADQAVLDLGKLADLALKRVDQARGAACTPCDDMSGAPVTSLAAPGSRYPAAMPDRSRPVPEQRIDRGPFPPGHAEDRLNIAVLVDRTTPPGEQFNSIVRGQRSCAERVAIAPRICKLGLHDTGQRVLVFERQFTTRRAVFGAACQPCKAALADQAAAALQDAGDQRGLVLVLGYDQAGRAAQRPGIAVVGKAPDR